MIRIKRLTPSTLAWRRGRGTTMEGGCTSRVSSLRMDRMMDLGQEAGDWHRREVKKTETAERVHLRS